MLSNILLAQCYRKMQKIYSGTWTVVLNKKDAVGVSQLMEEAQRRFETSAMGLMFTIEHTDEDLD